MPTIHTPPWGMVSQVLEEKLSKHLRWKGEGSASQRELKLFFLCCKEIYLLAVGHRHTGEFQLKRNNNNKCGRFYNQVKALEQKTGGRELLVWALTQEISQIHQASGRNQKVHPETRKFMKMGPNVLYLHEIKWPVNDPVPPGQPYSEEQCTFGNITKPCCRNFTYSGISNCLSSWSKPRHQAFVVFH